MRRRILLLLFALCTSLQWTMAQNPKWVEKAKHAVFSIVTYDKNDKILNTGNGFFVSEDGIALSDYALFKGAQRAVIINYEGKQMPVESIMGADDMYDVVKFRVGITEKKVPALSLSVVPPVVGADIYLLPYSTRSDRSCAIGKVKAADKIEGGYSYYTLDMRLADKMVSCPLATTDGQVFGMAQKSSGQDTATICYAIDVNFAMKQSISALSFSDMALNDIGIKKALPDTEEEALVFLGDGLKPLAMKTISHLSAGWLYWINTLSAVLDNATLAAIEVTPDISTRTLTFLLMSLIVSGGMLIPGNIPNIICASKLGIKSKEWAKAAVGLGAAVMVAYFIILTVVL